MTRRTRLILYSVFALTLFGWLLLSSVSWRMLLKAVTGPSAAECKIQEITISSPHQHSPTKLRVLLPDDFDPARRYPVLYVLPPVPASLDPWWNSGMMEIVKYDVANRYHIICVAPTFSHMPWYVDHPTDPRIAQETYFLKSVIPYIDEHFPTVAEGRGRYLIGYSKSGTGAFSLMLRHPQLFAKALSWDAPLKFDFTEVIGSDLKRIYGTEENFLKYHIPALLRERAHLFRNGPPRFVLMGYSENPDAIATDHLMFNDFGVPHIYDNSVRAAHQWHSGWFGTAVGYLLGDDRSGNRQ
ncbi:MAG: hypothetical protein KC897_09120 [Candidatus Omnitrophica bacterium]|nr:hypothetical protein [Candidatus Omnitrophota bacterium]MCB9722276.1 hypothetical protein [Candidatus Omnitrophota bacterium]